MRVTRCVRGAVISKAGFNYKTGRAHSVARKVYNRKGMFDSNAPPKAAKLLGAKPGTYKTRKGDTVYKCAGKSFYWYGQAIKDLPDRNFEIRMQFKTKSATAGLFQIIATHGRGGHDRHLALKGGRMYVRTWKGPGWMAAAKTKYNNNRWHSVRLVVRNGKGQKLYVDNKLIGSNKYDHSDFNWKNSLQLCWNYDVRNHM